MRRVSKMIVGVVASLFTVSTVAVAGGEVGGVTGSETGNEASARTVPELGVGSPDTSTLWLGPVDGFTTSWHAAPTKTAVPSGTLLLFRVDLAADEEVCWTGAIEFSRTSTDSMAMCMTGAPGALMVRASVCGDMSARAKDQAWSSECALDVVDTSIDDVTVALMPITSPPLHVDTSQPESALNDVTVGLFYGPSIARVRQIDETLYRTSTNRWLLVGVDVDPPGFAPLVEWRVNGESTPYLGSTLLTQFDETGRHRISAGPAHRAPSTDIDVYRVSVTRLSDGNIEEGQPEMFIATTEPPGYEDEVTWLASTKYGRTTPVVGYGPVFTAQFDDTWGPHPDGGTWQWIGVKADNAAIGQDQKCEEDPSGQVFISAGGAVDAFATSWGAGSCTILGVEELIFTFCWSNAAGASLGNNVVTVPVAGCPATASVPAGAPIRSPAPPAGATCVRAKLEVDCCFCFIDFDVVTSVAVGSACAVPAPGCP